MDACTHKFPPGIYYGLGMMEIRFKDFFFLARAPAQRSRATSASCRRTCFTTRPSEAHILLNFGDNTRMVESFRALIEIENSLQRMR